MCVKYWCRPAADDLFRPGCESVDLVGLRLLCERRGCVIEMVQPDQIVVAFISLKMSEERFAVAF